MTAVAHSWAQFPRAPAPGVGRTHRSFSADAAMAAVLVAVCPALATAVDHSSPAALATAFVGAAAGVAVVAMGRSATADWWHPLVPAMCAGVVAGLLGGWAVGVVTLALAALAGWVLGDRPPPGISSVAAAAAPAVAGASVAVAVAVRSAGSSWPLLADPAAVLLVAAAAARWPAEVGRIGEAVRRASAWLGRVVVTVAMAVVGLVVVCVPWALQRVVRYDPTWAPRRRGSRWVEVRHGDEDATRLWDPDPRRVRTSWIRRLQRVGMVLVALIAVLLGVGVTLGIAQARADHEQYSAPALASSPWWPHMSDAMDVMYGRSQISSYVGVLMRDASYPGFNVTAGRRHTWTPPTNHACGTLRVWVFGGSTLFGLGQRDGHTIPSELARLAWSEGIRLQVENWGVPADTRWMEVRRLELALAEGEPAPDLAVFYDGANDYRIQANMNSIGRGGQRLFANDLDGDALRGIEDSERFQASLMQLTRGGPKLTPEKYTVLPPEAVGDFAARGYAAAADLAEPVLRAHGIRAAWFYQPTRVTRSEPLASERPPPPQDNRDERVLERTFRSHLRPDDIDLSGAMDGTRQPVYYDVMHTNELGARVVAAAMFDHLRPQLLSLLASKGLAPCR